MKVFIVTIIFLYYYNYFSGFYDTVILDVDNKNPSLGISSPPVSFLEPAILMKMNELINETGN